MQSSLPFLWFTGRLVSDWGTRFTSLLLSAFFKELEINVSLTSGYYPQSYGQVERLNQELTQFLHSYCNQNRQDWIHYLMWAEYAQNYFCKPSTGLTLFQCTLGYQPPLFPWAGELSNVPTVNDWIQRSKESWNQAHHHLQAVRRPWTTWLQLPGENSSISGRLGRLCSRGEVLGECGWHSRSHSYGGLQPRPPGKTAPQTTWKTSALTTS